MPRVSFEQAFADHYATLYRYLYRRIGSEVAEELAAETFATAFSRWERFDQARPVAPWLYGIATNLLRRHYRDEERKLRAFARSGVDPVIPSVDDQAVEHAHAQRQQRTLAAALARLRVQEREVLLLHVWAELSDEEIATALSIPIGTVKSRMSRACTRLGNLLASTGQTVRG